MINQSNWLNRRSKLFDGGNWQSQTQSIRQIINPDNQTLPQLKKMGESQTNFTCKRLFKINKQVLSERSQSFREFEQLLGFCTSRNCLKEKYGSE